MKKKVLAVILAAALCMGLMACGNSTDSQTKEAAGTKEAAAEETGGTDEASGEGEEASGEKESLLCYVAYIGDFCLADMGWRAAQAAGEK